MIGYDPQACGARCDVCILRTMRTGGPVTPEGAPPGGFGIAVVGEAPGEPEIKDGRVFTGPPGIEITDALANAGVKRADAWWTKAVLCRPPDGSFDSVAKALRVENKRRATNGEPLLPHPVEACRPRLLRELASRPNILPAGGLALRAVTGITAPILAVRGGMLDGWLADTNGTGERFYRAEGAYASAAPSPDALRLRVLPTVHPAFVLRARRWTRVFREDIRRAVRWWRGATEWREPTVIHQPDPDTLRAFLASLDVGAYDVETDGIEPLTARLRCIAIGDADRVIVVPLLGIDGRTPFYPEWQEAQIKDVMRGYFADPARIKVGHNAGSYDRTVIEQHFGITPKPVIDTILLHRLVDGELPHGLGFVASLYAELSPAWKADRTATTAETDRELHVYCAYDVAQTARIMPPLFEHVRLRKQEACFKSDARIQGVCAEMHRVGMYVDQNVRAKLEVSTRAEAARWWKAAMDAVADRKFNPASFNQVRDLLYERWRLPIPDGANGKPKITKSGAPSTDDEAVRALLVHPAVSERQRVFLDALRRYRAAQKELGTYIVKLRPNTEDADEGFDMDDADALRDAFGEADGADDYEVVAWTTEQRRKSREKKRGIVDPRTGRMHPSYSAHVAVTGRLASSGPNAQNFPSGLRKMVTHAPGHILVGADADQIELRIAAARWRVDAYLRALALGADPHAATARIVFGDKFMDAAGWPGGQRTGDGYFIPNGEGKWGGLAKNMRDLAKRVQYAGQYWATVDTIWRVITSSEDAAGVLIYRDLTKAEVRSMYDAWLSGASEFTRGWEEEMSAYRAHGFLAEPILGRRRDFLDGENKNEIVNFPIQASGAAIMALATLKLVDQIPCEYAGPFTGLINQCHDALVLEVPEHDAERVARILTDAMHQTFDALPGVKFTGTAQIARNWKDA